jgi:hypothetical protein
MAARSGAGAHDDVAGADGDHAEKAGKPIQFVQFKLLAEVAVFASIPCRRDRWPLR